MGTAHASDGRQPLKLQRRSQLHYASGQKLMAVRSAEDSRSIGAPAMGSSCQGTKRGQNERETYTNLLILGDDCLQGFHGNTIAETYQI
jgi:hypothetical protein